MNGVNMHMVAYLSMVNASRLPGLKQSDQEAMEGIFNSALRGTSSEEYINRLLNAPRRNPDLQVAAEALSDQFSMDYDQGIIKLGEYELRDEYGATKCYQVTEQNSKVVFDLTFYFYGGIISGWSIKPEQVSYNTYRNRLAS